MIRNAGRPACITDSSFTLPLAALAASSIGGAAQRPALAARQNPEVSDAARRARQATPALGAELAYRQRPEDASSIEIDKVTAPVVLAAFAAGRQGYMRPQADINDSITVHATIGGIVEQRVAGVKGRQFDWRAPNDSPRAAEILAMTREQIPPGGAPAVDTKETAVMARLLGGGLAENLITKRGSVWGWAGATEINQQRMRFDYTTREPAFAFSPFDYRGVPLSSFDPGTFVYFPVHQRLADFSKRGYYRRLMTPWLRSVKAEAQWAYTIERWGDPILHFASDDVEEREKAGELGKVGPGVTVETKLSTKITPIQTATTTGTQGMPQHEFLTFERSAATICLLGAEQMVSVTPNQGSQNSAPEHANIRLDIIESDEDSYCRGMNSVARTMATLNFGPEAVDDAAVLVPLWRQPIDIGKVLDNFKKADELLGGELAIDAVYEKIGETRPGKDVETLRSVRAQRGAEASNLIGDPSRFPKGRPS